MKTLLLVWSEVPERTSVYKLKLTDHDFERALKAHGQFVNASDDDEAALWVQDTLLQDPKREEGYLMDPDSSGDPSSPVLRDISVDAVVVAGFIL